MAHDSSTTIMDHIKLILAVRLLVNIIAQAIMFDFFVPSKASHTAVLKALRSTLMKLSVVASTF